MTLPTFVVGGAPKAGTTALWRQLAQHPEVWMSPIKEPHFFTRDANEPVPGVHIIGPDREDTHSLGLSWYEKLFDGADEFPARGEASTHYIGATDGPELMERYAPGIKVIFVLRQPVDRAYSHYWHNWKRGWTMPPFSAILEDEPGLRYLLYMGRYREHVDRYLRAFGPDRVMLVLFDDLRSQPAETFAEISRFIGVDDGFRPEFSTEYNAHAVPANPILHQLIARSRYRKWDFIPSPLRRPAHRLRKALEARNLRPARYPDLDHALRERLLEYFAEDIAYVEERTRPLPTWRGIHSESPAGSGARG